MGFAVCKPYGDSERYDFIVDARMSARSAPACHPEKCADYVETAALGCPGSCPTLPGFRRVRILDRTIPRKDQESKAGSRGKNARSACILCARPFLWRVQVKCSTQLLCGLYRVNAHRRTPRGAVPYTPAEIDFIAAYIIPEDTWYIIPIRAVRGTSLLFRRKKDRRPSLYNQYREAWHLLRPKL